MDDRDSLAGRLKAGERDAAAELVDQYFEQIYLFMRRLGHDHQISEDLTQECFIRAWNHIGQLRDGKALKSWLYRIASNVSRHHWRRSKNRQLVNIEGIDMADEARSGSEHAGHREELVRLRQNVNELPLKLREAIILHYMQHLTISEAAEVANVRQGTFKSRLSRALDTLRKMIGS